MLCAGGSLAAALMHDDPPIAAINGEEIEDGGVKKVKCGNYCDNGAGGQVWCAVGLCWSDRTCCGHVNCFIGGCWGPLECCKSGQNCDNGLSYDPPKSPTCVDIANP